MNHFRIGVGGQIYDVSILSDPAAKEVEVEVDGKRLTVTVDPMQTAPAGTGSELAAVSSPAASAAPERAPSAPPSDLVSAPLPGVIKSVAVRPGQTVQAGQTLLVIEAMKMDNLLRASRAAVVKEVLVSVGSQVAHGESLLRYQEP